MKLNVSTIGLEGPALNLILAIIGHRATTCLYISWANTAFQLLESDISVEI